MAPGIQSQSGARRKEVQPRFELSFELRECQANPWIGNRNAPAVSFCEGFNVFNSAVMLVSPWPNNGQVVFVHCARYVISQPVSD